MGYWDMYNMNNYFMNFGFNYPSLNSAYSYFSGLMCGPIGSLFMMLNANQGMESYNFDTNSIFGFSKSSSENVSENMFMNGNSYIPTLPFYNYGFQSNNYSISDSFNGLYSFGSLLTPDLSTSSMSKTSSSSSRRKTSSGRKDFGSMSKSEAIRAAKNNSNLEHLGGGKGWSVSDSSFVNDIPYAKKGMSKFLTKLSAQIGETLVVTSALGTANSPHSKNGGHYDASNPKLDFGGGLTNSEANSLAGKLENTGYFSHILVEEHGDGTAHVDVKVKSSVLNSYA